MVRTTTLLFALILCLGCSKKETPANAPLQSLDVQGHRGCRGLLPENSIVGFLHALELGVTTLEMDVVITKDGQVVLSHEPFMSHLICNDSTGSGINEANERSYNIYRMTFEEVKRFDCGSIGHPGFEEQKGMYSTKPLLSEVIDAVESRVQELGLEPVCYNIATKSSPAADSIYHPPPEEFTRLVLEVAKNSGVIKYTILQSFDPRTLQAAKAMNAGVQLALLVENQLPPQENLDRLGFDPHIYSPEHVLVNQDLQEFLRAREIKLIPWTINDPSLMQQFIDMDVDGIITDYPDRLLKLIDKPSKKS
jgi:glycerophosphoryl diester phosphodiesterase